MKFASGIGEGRTFPEAFRAAAGAVAEGLGDAPADWVVAFVSPAFRKEYEQVADAVGSRFPFRAFLGCSAGGVIGGGREIEGQPALALWAASLPGVEIRTFHVEDADLPDLDAGPAPWRELIAAPDGDSPPIVVLADPFSIRADDLIAGLDFACRDSVKVGGLASGARGPGENALWSGRTLHRAGAVGALLRGPIALDAVVAQGCRPVGKSLQVTGSERNLLLSLDGKPALQALEETVEALPPRDQALARTSLHLGILMDEFRENPGAGDFLVRNLLGVDPARGILAVGEILHPGQTVRFHLRDARTSAEDLDQALARYARGPAAPRARGALLFSCLGRGVHLYGEPDHDTAKFSGTVGPVPLAGFFCSGEIGPVGGSTHLHGFTSSFGIFRPA